jgi:predicted PurR-regulated permease PerM
VEPNHLMKRNNSEMSEQPGPSGSPKWGATTKLVVALTTVALVAGLLVYFRQIIAPLLLAFMLAYLLYPLAARVSAMIRISWRTSVNVIYLALVIILGGLFTLTGLAIVQQAQSLIDFIERFITELPDLVESLANQQYTIGPFGPYVIDFAQFDITALTEQLLQAIQPILGQAGSVVTQLATSAASTLAWGMFVLLVSYFLLSESGKFPGRLVSVDIPEYNEDLRRLGRELANIWDSFLRGQLILSLLIIISYYILLNILGTRAVLVISLMAGLARFIPYLGPFATWIVTAIVAFVQSSNYFGLEPYQYALLVLVACLVMDQIFDNLISPRLLGQTLGVHPAGVLVAAIVVTRLIGIIGLVLAAPALATINLLGRYILRKMFDQDPWPEHEEQPEKFKFPWKRFFERLNDWRRRLFQKQKK